MCSGPSVRATITLIFAICRDEVFGSATRRYRRSFLSVDEYFRRIERFARLLVLSPFQCCTIVCYDYSWKNKALRRDYKNPSLAGAIEMLVSWQQQCWCRDVPREVGREPQESASVCHLPWRFSVRPLLSLSPRFRLRGSESRVTWLRVPT